MNQHEAHKKLKKTLITTLVLLAVLFVGLKFFAPKIGSVFGIISKLTNKNGDKIDDKPAPPQFIGVPEAVKDKLIKLSGFSQPGTKVKIFVNGPEKAETVTDSAGSFTFDNIEMMSGKNTIFAKAISSSGTESDKSEDVVIQFDTKKPKIEIESPKNGDEVRNLDMRVAVKGKTDEKCTVTVNNRVAVTHPDNTFELLLGVEEGEVEITVEARDKAGNTSTEKLKINYLKRGF